MTINSVCCLFCCKSNAVSLRYRCMAHYYDSNQRFNYYWCQSCEVLWLDRTSVGDNIKYDSDYYSFRYNYTLIDRFKLLLKRAYFDLYYYFDINIPFINEYVLNRIFRKLKILKDATIIDIGCGSGRFLAMLSSFGYKHVRGIDPYAHSTIVGNLSIEKKHIGDVNEKFDILNAHHVLEHALDPRDFIFHVNRILNENGIAIITIPRYSSLIESGGENSYLLQAPDHLTLFTDKSFRVLVNEFGFDVINFEFDGSGTFQWLVVSELWRKGINVKFYRKSLLKLLSIEDVNRLSLVAAEINGTANAANALYVLRKR